jgi:hypothetical protein
VRPCHSLKARGGMIRAFVTAAVLVAAVPAWSQPTSPTVRLETVNGESPTRGTLVSANAERIQFAAGDPILPDDLRSIAFGEVKSGATALSGPVVHLAGGGRISVRDAMLVDDACQATLSDGRSVKLSLQDVTAIRWSQTADAVWAAALAKPSQEHDLVIVRAEPQSTSIRAFVESISADSIEFDWDKQTRTLARSQVLGVVFARSEGDVPMIRKYVVNTIDGSSIPAMELRLSENGAMYVCSLSKETRVDVPVSAMQSIDVHSARITYLSDLQPAVVAERALVAFPRSWQADRNVLGEPLRAGTQTFEKGIGVQSGSSLTFELKEPADEFVAVLAVDPPGGSGGDCDFVILAEGREVARKSVHGGDPPVPIRIDISDARRLELRVEYGRNLDFGDHANWCAAHVVTSRDSNAN